MAKITWKQYQFLASYCIGRQCNDGSTYVSGSGSPLAADTSYQRAIDTFASGLHELTLSGVDIDAQFTIIENSPSGGNGSFLANLLVAACNYCLLLQSSVWPNSYAVSGWLLQAREILPEDTPSSGGAGGSLDAQTVIDAMTSALRGSPFYVVADLGEVYPEEE